jgi:predicted acyltransferase
VLFTTGAALQVFAVCYGMIEIKGWTGWTKPAVIYGKNAIAAYVLHIVVIRTLLIALAFTEADGSSSNAYTWIYEHLFAVWAGPWLGSLAFAMANVLLWLGFFTILAQRRIFIKV